MRRNDVAARRFRAFQRDVKAFRGARPWRVLGVTEHLLVRFPDEDTPWFAHVAADDSGQFVLALSKGATGLRSLREAPHIDDDADDEGGDWPDGADDMHEVSLVLVPWSELAPRQRSFLQSRGVVALRSALVPGLTARRGRRHVGTPNEDELQRLRQVMAACCAAAKDAGFLVPRSLPDEVRALHIGGDPRRPEFSFGREVWSWHDEPSGDARDAVPDDGDLAAWRRADVDAATRVIRWLELRDLPNEAAWAEYHGEPDTDDQLFEFALPAFYAWLVSSHVRSPDEPTALASALATDLPRAERMVLEARRDAVTTIVRTEELAPESDTLIVRDILTNEALTLHDHSLSRTAVPQITFGVTLVRLGGMLLPDLASPAISPDAMEIALEWLADRESESEITRRDLEERPELLGRLWRWAGDHGWLDGDLYDVVTGGSPRHAPELVYIADDIQAVESTIAAHPDVRYDDALDQYQLVCPDGIAGDDDGPIQARLEIDDDEVSVFASTARGAIELSTWFERMPGVRLASVDGLTPSGAPDESVPSTAPGGRLETNEAIRNIVRQRVERYYDDWLDQPIPALRGQTPREAAGTTEGREDVLALIDSLPRTADDFDVESTRQRLRRDLGLESDDDA